MIWGTQNLGVTFDANLCFDDQAGNFQFCFFHLEIISKMRSFLSCADLYEVAFAFSWSKLDYYNALYSGINQPPSTVSRLYTMLLPDSLPVLRGKSTSPLCFYFIAYIQGLKWSCPKTSYLDCSWVRNIFPLRFSCKWFTLILMYAAVRTSSLQAASRSFFPRIHMQSCCPIRKHSKIFIRAECAALLSL